MSNGDPQIHMWTPYQEKKWRHNNHRLLLGLLTPTLDPPSGHLAGEEERCQRCKDTRVAAPPRPREQASSSELQLARILIWRPLLWVVLDRAERAGVQGCFQERPWRRGRAEAGGWIGGVRLEVCTHWRVDGGGGRASMHSLTVHTPLNGADPTFNIGARLWFHRQILICWSTQQIPIPCLPSVTASVPGCRDTSASKT